MVEEAKKNVLHKKNKLSDEVKNYVENSFENDLAFVTRKINVDRVISTGSTLLDLAISGKRKRGGGVPGGIIVELYGPAGSGKTSVMQEIIASCQSNNGDDMTLDPEGRLDKEYSRIYGVSIDDKKYHRPDTVEEVFELVQKWKPQPSNEEAINVLGVDSLAALSTELEMTKGDKMGMKRAKEFSTGFRKTARIIANNEWCMLCTNQIRQGDYGEVTPGGLAIIFYASLRIRVKEIAPIEKEIDLTPKNPEKKEKKKEDKQKSTFSKIIGIKSMCFVKKSTVDDPYREVPIYIIFGYGIDDIRGNLQYIKDMTLNSVYECPDGKTYQSMDKAIKYVEEHDLQDDLKEKTISLWEEIESKFDAHRVPKRR